MRNKDIKTFQKIYLYVLGFLTGMVLLSLK